MAAPRIAIVNDDTAFLRMMSLLLTEEGYETLLVQGPDDAHQRLRDEQPDMVILDIRMGEPEAGWQLLELLRLDPETTRIPVLVCSAAVQELRAKADILRDLRCDILPKPFDLDQLLAKVRNMLGQVEGSAPK